MSRDMTKPTKWVCAQQRLGSWMPRLIRVFAVCMKKPWVLSYPLSAQQRLWSDWLIWVFAGRTLTLLVLSCRGSIILFCNSRYSVSNFLQLGPDWRLRPKTVFYHQYSHHVNLCSDFLHHERSGVWSSVVYWRGHPLVCQVRVGVLGYHTVQCYI